MSEENQNEVDDISEDEQDENLEDDTEFSEELKIIIQVS